MSKFIKINLFIFFCLLFCLLIGCNEKRKIITFMVDDEPYWFALLNDTEVEFPEDPIKEGYNFIGWFNGDTKVEYSTFEYTEGITLVAKWEIISCNIYYELNGGKNNENNPSVYTYFDESVVLQDPYKKGFEFIGWISEEVVVPTKNLEIYSDTFNDLRFEAIFEANTYTITFDVNGGDELDYNQMDVLFGEYVDLPIPKKDSFIFIGWSYGNEDVSNIWDIDDDVTLTAKWINIYEEYGKSYIDLGKYPQSVVTDIDLISKLDNITITNSRDYIEYEGEEYKKLVAKPYNYDYVFENGNKIIKDNIYYYKVEPIKWRVLQEDNGTYKLISEYILDNMDYYNNYSVRTIDAQTIYPNNYEYSNIRAWLNGYNGSTYNVDDYTNNGFLDIAFIGVEKNIINVSLVDNSVSSTNYSSNIYACNNTYDKIYILSLQEATNTSYGFNSSKDAFDTGRRVIVSDYARSKECFTSTSSNYLGCGSWWVRSPNNSDSEIVISFGDHGMLYGNYVNRSNIGICPVIEITIK